MLTDALRRHLLAAVAEHVRRLRRSGLTPPAGLLAYAIRASGGLGRTTVDGLRSSVDSDRVPPLALDYRKVADVLSVSERSVRRAVAAGELPAVEVAGCRRVRVDDLAEYVSGRQPINTTEQTP
jgi:excisionase family DNA binding protein